MKLTQVNLIKLTMGQRAEIKLVWGIHRFVITFFRSNNNYLLSLFWIQMILTIQTLASLVLRIPVKFLICHLINNYWWNWLCNNFGSKVALWCSDYHNCSTSFNKAWTQVLHRFKSWSQHVRDSQRWGSLAIVPAGNKTDCLSPVNHTTKTIH